MVCYQRETSQEVNPDKERKMPGAVVRHQMKACEPMIRLGGFQEEFDDHPYFPFFACEPGPAGSGLGPEESAPVIRSKGKYSPGCA